MKAIFYAFLLGLLMSNFSAHAVVPQAHTTLYAHMQEVNKEWSHQMTPKGHLVEIAFFDNDVDRIQKHLQLVEQELRSRPTAHLSADQASKRLQMLDQLQRYWMEGKFPINNHHAIRIPYFIDDFGTACAVGHLLIESGFEEVAQTIHTKMNQAYVHEIPYKELPAWAASHGFTVSELAWIQPGYSPARVYSSIGTGADAKVDLMVENPQNGSMLIAGQFTQIDSIPFQHVALYKNNTLSALGNGLPDGEVHAGIYFNGTWYIGGHFPQSVGPDANLLVWDGTDWILEYVGDGPVHVLAIHNGNLFAGGDFTTTAMNRVAKLDNGTWVPLGTGMDAPVYALVSHDNQLIAGGAFAQAGGVNSDYVAAWDGQQWQGFNQQGTPIDNTVRVLLSTGTELYAGGDIDGNQGNVTFGLAKWANAQTGWEHLLNIYKDPTITDPWFITDLLHDGTSLYIAGAFNTPISQNVITMEFGRNCGMLDLQNQDILPLANPNAPVKAIAIHDGKMYWGGEFKWNSSLTVHSIVNYVMKVTHGSDIDKLPEQLAVTIYPNPVQSEVFFHFDNPSVAQDLSLSLYNMTGQKLTATITREASGFRLNRGNLPTGTYYYQLLSKEGKLNRGKLIFK